MNYLDTILVTGYSKAPKETSLYETYKNIGIAIEVDFKTHKILNVDTTFIGDLPKDFFKRLLVGYDLQQGIDPLILRIKKHYYARSQNGVVVALQSAVQRYWDAIKNNSEIG